MAVRRDHLDKVVAGRRLGDFCVVTLRPRVSNDLERSGALSAAWTVDTIAIGVKRRDAFPTANDHVLAEACLIAPGRPFGLVVLLEDSARDDVITVPAPRIPRVELLACQL